LGHPSHWLFGLAGAFKDQTGFLNFLFDCVHKYGDVVKIDNIAIFIYHSFWRLLQWGSLL
jgi:hypothetical protein